jgi:hypothetical protein
MKRRELSLAVRRQPRRIKCAMAPPPVAVASAAALAPIVRLIAATRRADGPCVG